MLFARAQLLKAGARAAYEMLAWRDKKTYDTSVAGVRQSLVHWRNAQKRNTEEIDAIFAEIQELLQIQSHMTQLEISHVQMLQNSSSSMSTTDLHGFTEDLKCYRDVIRKAANTTASNCNTDITYLQCAGQQIKKITDDLWESGSKDVQMEVVECEENKYKWKIHIKSQNFTDFTTIPLNSIALELDLKNLKPLLWKTQQVIISRKDLTWIVPRYIYVVTENPEGTFIYIRPENFVMKWSAEDLAYTNPYSTTIKKIRADTEDGWSAEVYISSTFSWIYKAKTLFKPGSVVFKPQKDGFGYTLDPIYCKRIRVYPAT